MSEVHAKTRESHHDEIAETRVPLGNAEASERQSGEYDRTAVSEEHPGTPLTEQDAVERCVKSGYYRTPHCNEKLYLHYQGYDGIQAGALDKFFEARVVWLEGNALTTFKPVQHQQQSRRTQDDNIEENSSTEGSPFEQCTNIRQLYLNANALRESIMYDVDSNTGIPRCVNPFAPLKHLVTLNLSDNYLTSVQGLEVLAGTLTTLQIKNNRLSTVDWPSDQDESDESPARSCLWLLTKFHLLSCLDLSGNAIAVDGGTLVTTVLMKMPALRSLYLAGNPCVRNGSIGHLGCLRTQEENGGRPSERKKGTGDYRRSLLSRLEQLCYLDDRPVFDDERRLVTAWADGGLAAERAEKQKMKSEEDQKRRQYLIDFRQFMDGKQRDEKKGCDEADEENESASEEENVTDSCDDSSEGYDEILKHSNLKDEHQSKKQSKQASSVKHVDPFVMAADVASSMTNEIPATPAALATGTAEEDVLWMPDA